MGTQVLRMNYNHCKEQFAINYLSHKEALDHCVLATLMYIDKVKQRLSNLHFEDRVLQQHWVARDRLPHHEAVVLELGLNAYRHHLEDLHEQLELFLERKHEPKAQVVFVSLFLDATYHLCIQFRSF